MKVIDVIPLQQLIRECDAFSFFVLEQR